MNGGSSGLPQFRRAMVVCVVVLVLIAITGCTRSQPSRQEAAKPAVKEQPSRPQPSTPPLPPAPSVPIERVKPEPQVFEDSGKIVWVKGYEGILIAGLDDGIYEAYGHAVMERVQRALRDRGLYGGPVNGVLDKPTMEALYAFQKATNNLQRCGIPTPYTRKMLEQGSHTDPSS